MTDKLRAAARAALEALESCGSEHPSDGGRQWHDERQVDRAINDLHAALAEREVEQEPTAWCWVSGGLRGPLYHGPGPDADIAARAAAAETPRTVQYLWDGPPPRREWQSLTDDEITEAIRALCPDNETLNGLIAISMDEYRAIEAALKEKNNG